MSDILKSEIPKLTTEHYDEHRRALLLSTLGQKLQQSGVDLRSQLKGRKLLALIKSELAGEVTVIQHPADPLVMGLVPNGTTINEPSELFAASPSRILDSGTTDERIDRRIWAAFSVPLATDHWRRLTIFGRSIRFDDLPGQPNCAGEMEFHIPLEFIHPVQQGEDRVARARRIEKAIKDWAQENNIDSESLRASEQRFEARNQAGANLLELLVDALTHQERQRVSLPLDVIAKLYATQPR